MFANDTELDEGIVDPEYLRRKLEHAKRISELRGQRTKLRQELESFIKYEKTGEKPTDDPVLVAQVMKLNADLESESELQTKLKEKLTDVEAQLKSVKKQIQQTTDLIQKYKVEKSTELRNNEISSNGTDYLKTKKQNLEQGLKGKKHKLIELEGDIERLTKESDIKDKQNAVDSQVSNWQQGLTAEPTDLGYIQQAFQSYKTASESWREAKFNYERKNFMPDFYLYSFKALLNGIDAHYILLTQSEEDVTTINLQEKIDLLYKNKIVVNTTLIDSLINFVDRINHNVEVSPTPNYPDKIFEFIQKNMISLKTI